MKLCKDADLSDMEYALDSIAKSFAQQAREQAIEECSEIVRNRQECFYDRVDPLIDELLNLKEKK